MGLNALNRADDMRISATYNTLHFNCKIEDRKSRTITQPIKNLITDDTTMLISTRANYEFKKYEIVELLGRKFQVKQTQVEYDEANNLLNPNLLVKTYIALQEVDG